MTELIYKIFTPAQWAAWRELGLSYGSAADRRDGFIHFSTAGQLRGTLDKHFSTHDHLWLIAASASNLGPDVKWEPSRGGQLFPHLYAAFHLRSAKTERAITRRDREWTPLPGSQS